LPAVLVLLEQDMRNPGPGIVAVLAITIAAPARAQLPAVPSLPSPPLPVPSLPAPQLPSVPSPVPPVPQLPAAPAPQLPPAPAPAPAPAPPEPARPAPAPAAPAAPAAQRAQPAQPAPATAPARSSAVQAPAARASEAPEPARRGARRQADRRVRRLVTRYGACLPGLPARQRRVLRLRAGVGPREPASRAAVARRLEIPVARVRRTERRGLRALRRAARGGCAPASTSVTAGAAAEFASAAGESAAPTLPVESVAPRHRSAGRGAQGRDSRSRAGDGSTAKRAARGGVAGISATRPAPESGTLEDAGPLLLVLLAFLIGLGVLFAHRRGAGWVTPMTRAAPRAPVSDASWRCEIRWKPGYRTSSFRAVMHGPSRRGTTLGRSATFGWLLMGDPDPGDKRHVAEVRRLAHRLTSAGWEPAGRGGRWYSLRFAWRREEPPPPRL
jgi:hypothetical protein